MVTGEPGEGYDFTEEGAVIVSHAADGSSEMRTYGREFNGLILRGQGLSELKQDQFTTLRGEKRKRVKGKLGYGAELAPSGKAF